MTQKAKPEKVYRVLASSIQAADGTWCFSGTRLRASQIGDAATIQTLLDTGSIEEVTDD